MSPNKRKTYEPNAFDESDSIKHRRSSLRVNLSYTSNSTNSNNESARRTRSMRNNIICKDKSDTEQLSKKKISQKNGSNSIKSQQNVSFKYEESKQTLANDTLTHKGIQLKKVSVTIQDIGNKEQALHINCRRLKDAILNKTKQIFDKQNEFAIKTAAVLRAKDDSLKNTSKSQSTVLSSAINNNFICSTNTESKTQGKCANAIPSEIRPLQGNENDKNTRIIVTPRHSRSEKAIEKSTDKSTLLKKRLFLNKETSTGLAKNTNNDTIRDNSLPAHSVNDGKISSPIITGSTKAFCTFRPPLNLPNKLLNRHGNELPRTSGSATSEDVNISSCAPICSSTMIEENILEEANNIRNIEDQPVLDGTTSMTEIPKANDKALLNSSERSMIGDKDVLADKINKNVMEISKSNSNLAIGVRTNIQSNNLLTNNSKSADCTYFNNCSQNRFQTNKSVSSNTPVSMELTMIQRHILLQQTSNVKQKSDEIQQTQQTQQTASIVTDNSRKTIRSSLDVNTSIDLINDVDKNNEQEPECNIEKSQVNDIMPLISEDIRESVNTIRTSLQMNTSLDALDMLSSTIDNNLNEQTKHENSSNKTATQGPKQEIANNLDALEGTKLIEKLNHVPPSKNSKLTSNTTNEQQQVEKSKTNEGNESYVQATPYPTGRSPFLKTYLKHITVIQNGFTGESTLLQNTSAGTRPKSNSKNQEIDQSGKTLSYSKPAETTDGIVHSEKNRHKTIILDDTSISDLVHPKQCETVFIEDSLEKEEAGTSKNNSKITDNEKMQKKGKKKLMPLRESSQLLSLTPYEQPLPMKSTVIPKIQKRHRNKRIVKKLTQAAETSDKGDSLLEDNLDVRPAKKEKKKPRKIFSKKIIIRKRGKHDVLRQLVENTQKTNFERQTNSTSISKHSMNSFQDERTIPTQLHKDKSRKIIIVTTGLSKGDKNLVQNVVKTLGMARIEARVSRKTTHVVSTGVRTNNLLLGIIRGCWLVSFEWVLWSLENNRWIDPEKYELLHFSKAVSENRRDRQLFGDSYVPELFATCGLIHVESGTTPPCHTIKDLIKTAGGQITEDVQAAKIIIGAGGLKESWILDSITTGELQSYSLYKRQNN